MTADQFIWWLEGVLASHDTIQPSMCAIILAKIQETKAKPPVSATRFRTLEQHIGIASPISGPYTVKYMTCLK